MKKVAILTTGGTIAMGGPPFKVAFSIDDLLNSFPELRSMAELESQDVFSIDSSNMTPEHWQQLADATYSYLTRRDIDGIVITHGTDTMEYSTIALALMLQGLNKPVVFTGSMKTMGEDKGHVRRNLVDAIQVAAESDINEVTLCFAGDENSTYTNVYRGSRVVKYDANANNGFLCPHDDPIATVSAGRIIYNEALRHSHEEPNLITALETKVSLIGASPFNKSLFLDGLKGAILCSEVDESDPFSHMSTCHYEEIKKALSSGTIVGVVNDFSPSILKNDPELLEAGAIPLGDLSYSKALVKLAWVLPQCGSNKELAKQMMQQDYVGEITPGSYEIK